MALSRVRMTTQLRDIDTYGFKAAESAEAAAAHRPLMGVRVNELAERIGRSATGTGWRAPVEARSLRAAGVYKLTPEAFHGYRVMVTFVVPSFILLLMLASGSFGALNVLLILLLACFCWVSPALLVGTHPSGGWTRSIAPCPS